MNSFNRAVQQIVHQRVAHDGTRGPRLVVAPHAGDEVSGCGGMIAKHCGETVIVTLTDPDSHVWGQLRTAQRMLGDPESIFLGLPDGNLTGDMDQLVGALAEVIARVRPVELYLPYPWVHHDHLVVYEAGLRATRSPVTHGGPIMSVLVYGVGAVGVADYPADIHWGVREPLSEEDVDRKVAAAMAYRSSSARTLKSDAQGVGAAGDLSWAEQFARVGSGRPAGRRSATASTRDLAGVVR